MHISYGLQYCQPLVLVILKNHNLIGLYLMIYHFYISYKNDKLWFNDYQSWIYLFKKYNKKLVYFLFSDADYIHHIN